MAVASQRGFGSRGSITVMTSLSHRALEGCDMATTQLMLQFWVEESIFVPVTTTIGLIASGTILLDPHKTTVVREIASEEIGGVLGLKRPGAVNLNLTTRTFTQVDLSGPKGAGTFLLGPSCVPSPPFAGMGKITLNLTEAGFTAPAGGELSVQFVGAGGHVYVDQI